MKRVTMGLSPADVENTETISRRFQSRSKASAVGTALSITAALTRELEKGNEILVRTPSGEFKQMVFAGYHPVK